MSNKHEQLAERPSLYSHLSTPTKTVAAHKIVIDPQGKIHGFKDASVVVPAEIHVDKVFENFDAFAKLPKQTILAYHEEIFKSEPPKKQDPLTTALMIWAHFVRECTPHMAGTDPVTGERERKSSLKGRQYFRGNKELKDVSLPTYQARKCYEIFIDSLEGKPHVTEEQLKQLVITRQAELRTRQDPWRIFQYYRPKLISLLLIRYA